MASRQKPKPIQPTDKMPARPVWARRCRRLQGEWPMELPTEEEKADAIRVLEANITVPWSLYQEAELILHDSI